MDPLMAMAAAFWATALGGGFYFIRRYVRAVERRATQDEALAELRARLAMMEEVVDGLRTDVERLESGQEFTTKLLAGGARPTTPPT